MTMHAIGFGFKATAANRGLHIVRTCLPISSAMVLLFLFTASLVQAQPAGRVYRIGFLGNSTPTLEANLVFRPGSHVKDSGGGPS
jgi:hypothetical protein